MDKKRILVVDDDRIFLNAFPGILGDEYELSLADDPEEALALSRASFYSLAILDQRITPEVSGLALLERLHGIQRDLRCIILTGYAEIEDAVKSMKSGAVDYLSKGRADLAEELRARVTKILEIPPHEDALRMLLKSGESAEVEFKSSLRWDPREKRVNKELELVVVRTVAAFLNTEAGGTLLIGVDDNGQVKGLQDDYKTLNKQSKDGFELLLWDRLTGIYGKDLSPLLRIDFPQVGGVDICRVCAKPSPKPIYVPDGKGGQDLCIRSGNSTRKLNTEEAIEYSRVRWRW